MLRTFACFFYSHSRIWLSGKARGVTLLPLERVDAILFSCVECCMGLRKLCGFSVLCTMQMEHFPLNVSVSTVHIPTFPTLRFSLAYGVCFKSRDIVIFNFLRVFKFITVPFSTPIQNTNLCPSVLYYLACHHLYLTVLSISFVWFLSLAWPVLSTVFIYFSVTSKLFHLSNCFIFHLPFISWALLAHFSTSFLLISRLIISIASLNFLSEKLYRQFLEDRQLNSVLWNRSFVTVYICHLPSVFISSFFLQYHVLGVLAAWFISWCCSNRIGAPSFLIDSCVEKGTGGMVNWAQNLVMVSALLPNRPWWVASFRLWSPEGQCGS